MDLNLPVMSVTCFVTGERFVEDERVVSMLIRHQSDGAVMRYDVKPDAEATFEAPGRVACRWTHDFKARVAGENPEREMKLTAETLFLTLADPAAEISQDEARLVQFLALMLERKRTIKLKGRNPENGKAIYEHRGTKGLYEVPPGELSPAFFIAVQEQLSVLVGVPDRATPAAANATPGELLGPA